MIRDESCHRIFSFQGPDTIIMIAVLHSRWVFLTCKTIYSKDNEEKISPSTKTAWQSKCWKWVLNFSLLFKIEHRGTHRQPEYISNNPWKPHNNIFKESNDTKQRALHNLLFCQHRRLE